VDHRGGVPRSRRADGRTEGIRARTVGSEVRKVRRCGGWFAVLRKFDVLGPEVRISFKLPNFVRTKNLPPNPRTNPSNLRTNIRTCALSHLRTVSVSRSYNRLGHPI